VKLIVAFVVLAGCDKPSPPSPPEAVRRDAGVVDASTITLEAAKLPGAIWFVDEGPPRRLSRLANGQRLDLAISGGDRFLFPSRSSLPDGRLVAIGSRGDGSAESEQLALIAPDGKVTRIGPQAAMVRNPAVDPRGRWIVVDANLDGHSDLYRIDLDTQQSTRITNDPQGNFSPTSLGADAIAFASSRDGDSEIYRMPVAGGKPQRLTAFHRDDLLPSASPDGKTIAFHSDREGPERIFLMEPDGTRQRRLTRLADEQGEVDVVWSRDGKRLAYLVERRGVRHVWLRELATGLERELTPDGASDLEPSFSPDGAWLVVSRTIGGKDDLWAIAIADGTQLQITDGGGAERLPRWH